MKDPVDRDLLTRLAGAINGGWEVVHQMLVHPDVVQQDPRAADDLALLQPLLRRTIGFEFLDAGDLLIFGPPDAIRDGAGIA